MTHGHPAKKLHIPVSLGPLTEFGQRDISRSIRWDFKCLIERKVVSSPLILLVEVLVRMRCSELEGPWVTNSFVDPHQLQAVYHQPFFTNVRKNFIWGHCHLGFSCYMQLETNSQQKKNVLMEEIKNSPGLCLSSKYKQ